MRCKYSTTNTLKMRFRLSMVPRSSVDQSSCTVCHTSGKGIAMRCRQGTPTHNNQYKNPHTHRYSAWFKNANRDSQAKVNFENIRDRFCNRNFFQVPSDFCTNNPEARSDNVTRLSQATAQGASNLSTPRQHMTTGMSRKQT